MSISFPTDRPDRLERGAPAVRIPIGIDEDLRFDIAERADKLGVTPARFLLTAYTVTVARWTGARRTPVRTPDGILDVTVDDDATVDDHIQAVFPATAQQAQIGYGTAADVEVGLVIDWADPAWPGYLECQSHVCTPDELAGFAGDLLDAAAQMTAAAGPLEDVRAISPARRAWLAAINHAGYAFDETSLDELIRRRAAAARDAVAVRDDDHALTYAELAAAADEQARRLHAAGVRPGDIVLVGVSRSVAEIVAVLGTVTAGAAYVGVDLNQPAAYLERIVARCRPAAILADREHTTGVRTVDIWSAGWATTPSPAPRPAADPDRLAYVAFTSGSTGEPKGVCIPHRGVIRLIQGADYVRYGAGEHWLRLAPLGFDASTMEIWGPLLSGGTVEVYTPALPAPSELGEFIAARGVTTTFMTSGLYRLMIEFAPDSFAGVRCVMTGGDVIPHEHTARLLRRVPGLTVVCAYGPTENSVLTSVHPVSDPSEVDGALPIGRPILGTGVHVLDERGRLVPPGAIGELYTSGIGLAVGYLGDPAETDRRFGHLCADLPERLYRTGDLVRFDTTGSLRFLGRGDDQVKIRGFRIELGAIAQTLTECSGVHDSVVFAAGATSATKRIVAAVVPSPGAAVDPVGLRDALAERLPGYMVPTLWTIVDHIPVTRNGKTDRAALLRGAAPAVVNIQAGHVG